MIKEINRLTALLNTHIYAYFVLRMYVWNNYGT